MNARLLFDNACCGLVSTIQDAANHAYPAWVPYRGDMIRLAVWLTRRVVRMARACGAYQ